MKLLAIFILVFFTQFIEKGSSESFENNVSLNQISESKDCADDVKNLCKKKLDGDISTLACLQDNEMVMKQLSIPCQNFLWSYKHKLTTSNYFDKITKENCEEDLNSITECKDTVAGYKVPCLLDHKAKITSQKCSVFLFQISVVIFSDYHIIYKFIDKCRTDVVKFKCGRITTFASRDDSVDGSDETPLSETKARFVDYITSQSHTVECLIDSIQDVRKDCQHQILRLSELQSNDYHLNRGLYLACFEDREALCPNVLAGNGRVYSCLIKEKFNHRMSERCRTELTRKQKLESLDVEADFPLFQYCKKDIIDNNCREASTNGDKKIVVMSLILMCLNDVELRGKKVDPNCRREINAKRLQMMDDHKISPEVLTACRSDLQDHCQKLDNEPGEVVHCLMKLAEPDFRNKNSPRLSETCKAALMTLIKAAEPTGNILQTDMAIRQACTGSFLAICGKFTTERAAFTCLTSNLDSPNMESKCREKLNSFMYFISMDMTIDPELSSTCHLDAVRLCNGPKTPKETLKRTESQAQLEYHCMFEYYKNDRIQLDLVEARGEDQSKANLSLARDCFQGISNLVIAQATKIEIDPRLMGACFDDLARYCASMEFKGREHECLQINAQKLEMKCYQAVIKFSQLEDVDSRLNKMITKACSPMIELFCSHISPDKAMLCLVEHKYNPKMSSACQIGIEHFQIIGLEDYRIDHRFSSFCGPEINKYCGKELAGIMEKSKDGDRNNKVVAKSSIVSCLSKMVTDKLLNGDKYPLSDECRRQFSFELLQRSESIKLDPSLLSDCYYEIKEYCSNVKSTEINSCLRQHQDHLRTNCHKRLFKRERLEALDADFDGELQSRCKEMIHKHCHDIAGSELFRCLHGSMNVDEFDRGCKAVIMVRLERRMNDVRLNPDLIKDCSEDIKMHCKVKNPLLDKPNSGLEYEGVVIRCLKERFVNNTKSLHPNCQMRIRAIIIEANLYARLDPSLRRKCAEDIEEHCKEEMKNENAEDTVGVNNCLKHAFLLGKMRKDSCKIEITRLLKEGKADVHVDKELFIACEDAIMRLCRSDSFGGGKKMNCLLDIVENIKSPGYISTECLTVVKERKEMWLKAGSYDSQSLHDLLNHITNSPTHVYLLSMLGLIITALVLAGVCFGRVTKRVAVDLKNK